MFYLGVGQTYLVLPLENQFYLLTSFSQNYLARHKCVLSSARTGFPSLQTLHCLHTCSSLALQNDHAHFLRRISNGILAMSVCYPNSSACSISPFRIDACLLPPAHRTQFLLFTAYNFPQEQGPTGSHSHCLLQRQMY